MKKLFFYAAAAIAMLASCQRAEVENTPASPIDDSVTVPMQFGVNAPSFAVTKAAVEEWDAVNGTPVQVIGLVNKGTVADPVYDFTAKVFDQEAVVKNEDDKIELYDVNYPNEKVPYFYGEGKLYDFYAYHLGGADADPQDETVANTITLPVTISGSEDLMVAQPNKAKDIMADISADGVTVNDVYSAWAARRNVHPTLVFQHALTRFNFIVRGMDAPAEKVTVEGISMTGLAKTGTLTVVGKNLGFVADEVVANDDTLSLKNADDTPYTEQPVTIANAIPAGNGSSLMVQPDLEKIHVVVDMHHTVVGAVTPEIEIDLDPYEFDVDASQVLKEGVAAGLTKFEKGTAYNIYINVYGPQEIIIKAELTDWAEGGDYTYDPDQQRPGVAATSVTAERTVEAGVISYAINYSSDITAIQGAIAKAAPAEAEWQNLIDTRAVTGIAYTLKDGDNAEDFKLYVRYSVSKNVKEPAWTVVEDVKPQFAIAKSYVVYGNEESYNQLPETYRTKFGEWNVYLSTVENNPVAANIPWLAVEFTPGATISGTAVNGDFVYNIPEAKSSIGLLLLPASEMGLPCLTPGEWTITLNGVRTKINVDGLFKKAYYVTANEKSYNQLPQAYRTNYGEWKDYLWTKENNPAAANLPWLAVEVTPSTKLDGVVVCGDKKFTVNSTAGSIGLCTFTASELDLAEITPGTWTFVLNNEAAYVVVK